MGHNLVSLGKRRSRLFLVLSEEEFGGPGEFLTNISRVCAVIPALPSRPWSRLRSTKSVEGICAFLTTDGVFMLH
jgi:hypothetical protein